MSDPGDPHHLLRPETAGRVLRDFIGSCPAAFLMLDHNLRQLEASPRWRADFGGIATGLSRGKHMYESYPDLPDHLRASHRRGLAGQVTRVMEDCFIVKGVKVKCAWEVRPWGDITHEVGGIIIYAENLNKIPRCTTRDGMSPDEPACPLNTFSSAAGLLEQGALWARDGLEAMQSLLSGYREIACTCEAQGSPRQGHQHHCPAHSTVPLIIRAERTVRRLFMLKELLRQDWTSMN